MSATVGKYVLKTLDQAADWIKNIKFGKNADVAGDDSRVMVVDINSLERQLMMSEPGRGQLLEPGGIPVKPDDLATSKKYADFVEFAESTDQPIHMPVLKVDDQGDLFLGDGSVTLNVMRDAGLTEIPVMVSKADTRAIPGDMLSLEGMTTVFNKDVPVTKPVDYKPKSLNAAQQKQFDQQVEAGRPAHTAKSIVLGEIPMDLASREARRIEQGIKNSAYHRGSPDIKNIDAGDDGFFMAEDPLVSASYPGRDDTTATYKLFFDDKNMLGMNAFGRKWNQLAEDRNLDDVIINDFPVYTPDGQELKLHSEMGSGANYTGTTVEDTNDLAQLARAMNTEGMVIDNIHDLGGQFGMTKKVFGEMNKNLLPANKNIFDARWADFLQDYDREGGTNIVSATGRGIRSAIGAAYDKRNKAIPNILGGGTALAVGLDSEASTLSPELSNRIFDQAIGSGVPSPRQQTNQVLGVPTATQQIGTKTYAENMMKAPFRDVGSIQGVPANPVSQTAGNIATNMQNFGRNIQEAGPIGFMAGSAIEDAGNRLNKAAYGESDFYDPAMILLDMFGVHPASYMSSGMRGAMTNPDARYSVLNELLRTQ